MTQKQEAVERNMDNSDNKSENRSENIASNNNAFGIDSKTGGKLRKKSKNSL